MTQAPAAASPTAPLSHPPTLATLWRFSGAAWRASPPGALADVALTFIAGLIPAAMLWAGRGLVNAIAAAVAGHAPRALPPLLPWVVALAVIAVAGSLAHTAAWALTGFMRPKISLTLERSLLEAAASIDLIRLEQPEVYDQLEHARAALGYRLTNLLLFLATVIRLAATLAAYAALLWTASPYLTLVVALPALPSAWLKVRAARSGYIHDYDATPVRRMMAYLRGLLLGGASGQEVRLFGLTGHFGSRWEQAHGRFRKDELAQSWTQATSGIVTTACQIVAYAAAVAILAALIAGGRLNIGDYVVLTGAAAAFQGDLEGLLFNVRQLMQDMPYLRDLQRFLDLAAATRASAGKAPFPRPLRQGLTVEGLRFRYRGASTDTLRGVTFQVRPGETVAIVGANGAGKSTLIKLLLGLYRPDAGSIRYDSVDVATIDPAAIAANCAAVFQDFARFRRPAREELAPGDGPLQADDAALWAAADAAGIGEHLRTLSRRLDTFLDPSLGEDGAEGAELSGGQWQKIAIARALARQAQVLVLDEPTAALDPQAEVDVYKGFAVMARGNTGGKAPAQAPAGGGEGRGAAQPSAGGGEGRGAEAPASGGEGRGAAQPSAGAQPSAAAQRLATTTFLISHRIGSARLADRILVLQDGCIAEQGTHDGLLAAGGLYARFFEAQARWYRPDAPAAQTSRPAVALAPARACTTPANVSPTPAAPAAPASPAAPAAAAPPAVPAAPAPSASPAAPAHAPVLTPTGEGTADA